MLESDEIIYNYLIETKENGNELLQHFHIKYPDKNIVMESNSIFVGAISSETETETNAGTEYRDLIEILVTTKIKDHDRAVRVIKTTIREVIRVIKECPYFTPRPRVRNISADYDSRNYLLNRGHIMVECLSGVEDYDAPDDVKNVCKILVEDMEVE